MTAKRELGPATVRSKMAVFVWATRPKQLQIPRFARNDNG